MTVLSYMIFTSFRENNDLLISENVDLVSKMSEQRNIATMFESENNFLKQEIVRMQYLGIYKWPTGPLSINILKLFVWQLTQQLNGLL